MRTTLKIRLSLCCKRCSPILLEIEDRNLSFNGMGLGGRDGTHLPEQSLDSTLLNVFIVGVSKSMEEFAKDE